MVAEKYEMSILEVLKDLELVFGLFSSYMEKHSSPPVIFGRFYAVLSVAAPIVGRFYAVLSVTASKIGFLSVIGSPGFIHVWFLYNLIV